MKWQYDAHQTDRSPPPSSTAYPTVSCPAPSSFVAMASCRRKNVGWLNQEILRRRDSFYLTFLSDCFSCSSWLFLLLLFKLISCSHTVRLRRWLEVHWGAEIFLILHHLHSSFLLLPEESCPHTLTLLLLILPCRAHFFQTSVIGWLSLTHTHRQRALFWTLVRQHFELQFIAFKKCTLFFLGEFFFFFH